MHACKDYPPLFLELIEMVIRQFGDRVDSLIRKHKLSLHPESGVRVAVWMYLLNLKSRKFAAEVLPFRKLSTTGLTYWLRKVREVVIASEEWRLLKQEVWSYWTSLIEERVTNDPAIIKPLRGYVARLGKKDFEDNLRDHHSRASVVMIAAFLKARGIGKDRSAEALSVEISGVPIYLLFMVRRPPTRKTIVQKLRRNVEEEVYVNAVVHRELAGETVIHTADGMSIPAQHSDADAYIVVDGRGKKTYGYQAVIISSDDMFPEAADLAKSDVKNKVTKKNKEPREKAL